MEVFVWLVVKGLGILAAVVLGIFVVALIGHGVAGFLNWAYS